MPGCIEEGRSGTPGVQGEARRARVLCHAFIACVCLAGCADPLSRPIDLYHGLEGGEIAAERPPPPGAGEPYPHIGTVPPKPVVPTPGFRTALENELAAERDQKELLAAALPQDKVPPPPDAATKPPPASTPSAPPGGAAQADSGGASNATVAAADAPAAPAAAPTVEAPPHDAGLQIVGEPVEYANLPLVPDGPPPPASFEGVPALPPPAPRAVPQVLKLPQGRPVFFANGAAVLTASQMETVKEIAGSRGKKTIDIIGLGDADSDTPVGQEAALDLGLRRARAIADAFAAQHVPDAAMRISARPYGRGALIRLLP